MKTRELDRMDKMLADQRAFNQQIFNRHALGQNDVAMRDRIKELAMGVIEETLEFLRTFQYKVHRRHKLRMQNTAHSHEELMDMFKYWLSLADINDFPMDRLEEMYYAKSRVVQYRYQEEWLSEIDRPCVVVDIDQVLGDYITGICNWALKEYMDQDEIEEDSVYKRRLIEIAEKGEWVDAEAVGRTHMEWQGVKHRFRTMGGKRLIPVFADAQRFLRWCRDEMGWLVLLITSRPVAEYPNIFTDTVTWLHENDLPFDRLWWTEKKSERLAEANLNTDQIVFAVDDTRTYVEQFARKGVRTYWLRRPVQFHGMTSNMGHVTIVNSLDDLMKMEKERQKHVV